MPTPDAWASWQKVNEKFDAGDEQGSLDEFVNLLASFGTPFEIPKED